MLMLINIKLNVILGKQRLDPYDWFRWYFRYWMRRRSLDDKRQIARWNGRFKEDVEEESRTRFKGKLIKMITLMVNGRYDDYSISSKIRQILLHWGYELWFVMICFFFVHIKLSYYFFNR